jgi:hypothetical protein
MFSNVVVFLGLAPRPPGSASRSLGTSSCQHPLITSPYPAGLNASSLGKKTFHAKKASIMFRVVREKREEFPFLGGKPPNPPGSASRKVWAHVLLRSRTDAFCFFFWKKKELLSKILVFPERSETIFHFLGASPQTPLVPLRGRFGVHVLLRSRTNAFCFFFWKKKKLSCKIRPHSFSRKK